MQLHLPSVVLLPLLLLLLLLLLACPWTFQLRGSCRPLLQLMLVLVKRSGCRCPDHTLLLVC
jgi:hypothetical protein